MVSIAGSSPKLMRRTALCEPVVILKVRSSGSTASLDRKVNYHQTRPANLEPPSFARGMTLTAATSTCYSCYRASAMPVPTDFQWHVSEAMRKDPDLSPALAVRQLEKLIVEPLEAVMQYSRLVWFVIDALDECKDDKAVSSICQRSPCSPIMAAFCLEVL